MFWLILAALGGAMLGAFLATVTIANSCYDNGYAEGWRQGLEEVERRIPDIVATAMRCQRAPAAGRSINAEILMLPAPIDRRV